MEEPQKLKMENETNEHIAEEQIGTHQSDVAELHRELDGRFNAIIELIQKDRKIDEYLQEIKVTAKEL